MEFIWASVQNTALWYKALVCVGWQYHHIYCMLTAELRSVTLWYRGVKIAEINTGMCGVQLVDSADWGVLGKQYHMTVEALQFSIK